MSVTSIIFSKNRPAQLDLLLRSMKVNAPAFLAQRLVVIVKATNEDYEKGYRLCWAENLKPLRGANNTLYFLWEGQSREIFDGVDSGPVNFHDAAASVIENAPTDKIAFFVDDDVIYRPLPVPNPAAWLDLFPETLAFSLRLGLQTEYCYPLRSPQELSEYQRVGEFIHWNWRDAELDFGYPGSLDGHIFRRDDLLTMLDGAQFSNPNQLEEALMRGCQARAGDQSHLAAFTESVLVGVPANIVNDTHPNRHAQNPTEEPSALNAMYLAGHRLALDTVVPSLVNAAHVEFPLHWREE